MIYLKEPITDNIVKFDNENQIGAGFAGWKTLTQDEANNYELSQAKIAKIAQLNKNRSDYCLEPILYDGNYYATTSNAQIAITYYIASLIDDASALYPNYPDGNNILLTRQDFINIALLIESKEMSSRDLRKTRTDEINAIEITPEVTYEQAMEALNNIDITF
jgi:hypothetical protein